MSYDGLILRRRRVWPRKRYLLVVDAQQGPNPTYLEKIAFVQKEHYVNFGQ